ncbi:unnamed protein product [Ostreobium quekettii]|uniref:Uncharacterized protein n=1 Tax=Ostreobium quekettii TaxID=121088 RepID=A0A8S1ILI3_9CHLO|nr:unnamed protein product [Ostreobium quekettii]|eukprot:evm.model.scf_479.9 EVM.evm.TU.scf_479.9   scf_479:62833-65489(+)
MDAAEIGVAAGLMSLPGAANRRVCVAAPAGGRRRAAKTGPSCGRPCGGSLTRPSLARAPTGVEQSARAEVVARGSRGDGSFTAGFLVGGIVCGVLGFLYAPQISRTLLDEQQRLKLPKFLEDKPPVPVTKDELVLRVDELNAAVDQLAKDLGGRGAGAENSKDPKATEVTA